MPNTIQKVCLNCKNKFSVLTKHVKSGGGKFCSQKCASRYNANKHIQHNVICAYCNKSFHRKPSKLKSKSGLYFCCKNHKHKAQKISAGFTELHPPHYGKIENDYRKLAFDNYSHKCNRCPYDKRKDVLVVHHIDHNRQNNALENLEILCRNCHHEHHLDN